MQRTCLACHQLPGDTIPNYPALCSACLDLAGDDIAPGCPVVCTMADDCGGTVDRLEDDGFLVVVRTHDGGEAWLPIQEVVRVQPLC